MASPATISIPEDILAEIFRRLSCPADLARTSTACTAFCRVIADRAFRCRFRSLHPPPLLGFALDDGVCFLPGQSPLACAVAGAADFSYSSVPSPKPAEHPDIRWRPRGVLDGRVLLDWISAEGRGLSHFIYPDDDGVAVGVLSDLALDDDEGLIMDDPGARLRWIKRGRTNAAEFRLAVCDPLSRRYVLIPPIPEDLAAQPKGSLLEFEPMLAPAGDGDDGTQFRVICVAKYVTTMAAFVFSSATRQWRVTQSPRLKSFKMSYCLRLSCFEYVRGCFYWTQPSHWSDELLVLDTRNMEFSVLSILTGYHLQLRDLLRPQGPDILRRPSAIGAGRHGALAMFCIVCQDGSFAIHHTTLQNGTEEWQLEKIVQLPAQYRYFSVSTVGAAGGFFFFGGAPEDSSSQNVDCFSLEFETGQISKVCSKTGQFLSYNRAYPYFGYPPSLSEPTI